MARPTDYNLGILEQARVYLKNLPADEVVHSIEGLAEFIGIARSTIYDWASQEDKKEFSDILDEVKEKQAKTLVNMGLKGVFNSKITTVMLSKHGYREGHEFTGKDGTQLFKPSPEEQILINRALADE